MMNKKIAMFTIAMVLLLGVTMGVTFALMTSTSETVTNTFVAGKFGDLTLDESPVQKVNGTNNYVQATGNRITANSYDLVPGAQLYKDPAVTFAYKNNAPSGIAYYVFVEIIGGDGWTINSNSATYAVTDANDESVNIITFNIDTTKWDKLDSVSDRNIYVYIGGETDGLLITPLEQTDIFNSKTHTVNSDATAEDMEKITSDFTLIFNGYAAQAGTDAETTWTEAFANN